MKHYSLAVALLLAIPFLFDLIENGGFNFIEIANDFMSQTICGMILFRAHSLFKDQEHPTV